MSQDNVFSQPEVVEMIAAFSQVMKELNIDYFVIGAVARDIGLSRISGYTPGRATKDVDIAIMVGSEQEFHHIKAALAATDSFTMHESITIKLFYKQRIELDLLPFGKIEGEDREVRIEKPRPFVLDMPGFKEVLPNTETVTVNGVDMIVLAGNIRWANGGIALQP